MTRPRKTRNLTDLAQKAGVTAATASMALRNSPRLSEAVKNKIQRIAEEDGFTPRAYTRKSPVQSERMDMALQLRGRIRNQPLGDAVRRRWNTEKAFHFVFPYLCGKPDWPYTQISPVNQVEALRLAQLVTFFADEPDAVKFLK